MKEVAVGIRLCTGEPDVFILIDGIAHFLTTPDAVVLDG